MGNASRWCASRRGIVTAILAAALAGHRRSARADGAGPAISRGEWGDEWASHSPVTLFVGQVERLVRLYFIPTSDPESFLMSHVFRMRVERVLAGDVPPVVDVLVHGNSETTTVSIPNQAVEPGRRYLVRPLTWESGDLIAEDGALVVNAGYQTARLTRRTERRRLSEAAAFLAARGEVADPTPDSDR